MQLQQANQGQTVIINNQAYFVLADGAVYNVSGAEVTLVTDPLECYHLVKGSALVTPEG